MPQTKDIDARLPIASILKNQGWKGYQFLGRTILCKRFPDAPRCLFIDDLPGVQLVVNVYDDLPETAYEIDLTAQKPDGVWVKLSVYGIGSELLEILDEQCNQLVSAWTAMVTPRR